MITSIPIEIQQLILIQLPVDKNLAKAPWISKDMAFVQKHIQATIDRREVVFKHWMHMPPIYRAACLSLEIFWANSVVWGATPARVGNAVKVAVIHEIITSSAPQHCHWHQPLCQDGPSMNVLIWAAANGAVGAVRLLLHCGIQTSEAFMGIAPSILNSNIAFDPAVESNSPLFYACSGGHSNVVELLLQDPRVDPNAVVNQKVGFEEHTERRNRPLLAAARNGHKNIVRLLLSDKRRDGEESEALVEASQEGHASVVDLLVKDGRARASWQNSACLRQACRRGHLAVVKLLLTTTDADINAYEVGTWWDELNTASSPFRDARKNGDTDVVDYLVSAARLDLNSIANSND
ncbi:ankyrin repeat-containing domain protein [Chytriomyces cf. hyalinus JEL632]|nr:ankyrin repeat-containing domain protein [Chytriomyces cf. hyalinus JEL632]